MEKIEFRDNLPLRIVEDLLARRKGKDFSDVLILLPNKRPAYYIIRILQDRLKTPFFPPHILSIDEFVEQTAIKVRPGFSRAGDLDRVWILFNIARRAGLFSDCTFHHFFIWGLRISDIIDELVLEEVDEKKLKNLPSGPVPEEVGALVLKLGEVKRKFFEELGRTGFTTRGMDFLCVADAIGKAIMLDEFNLIYVAGFFAPTRIEQRILDYILGLEKTVNFVQEEWRGWNFRNIFLHSGFDLHSQIKRVGEILQERLDPVNTAVVLPEADGLIPLLSMVVSGLGKEYNITMGYPLYRTPAYALLDGVMKFQETKVEEGYYAKDYISILLHPYVKNLVLEDGKEARAIIYSIKRKIEKEWNRAFISIEAIEKYFPEITEVHRYFIREMESVKTFGHLGVCFENILSFVLLRSPAGGYPFAGEIFEMFFKVFREMQESVFSSEEMQKEDIFDLFRYYVRNERVPFNGIPLGGLQILGVLETRNLSFEKVVVIDVQEGIIPSVDKYDPVLPTIVREFLGLPTYREREKVFRHHFMSLVNTAKEVHLIYRSGQKEGRSRFVEEILWEKEQEQKRILSKEAVKQVNFRVETIARVPPPLKKDSRTLQLLKNINFSPSAIDRYLSCPARFYYDSILELEEKRDIALEPDSGKIGSCIHKILQRFYKPFEGKKVILKEEDEQILLNLVERCIREDFGEIRGDVYLLYKIAEYRLKNFFDNEKTRENWKILYTEKEYNNVPFPLPGLGRDVLLKGIIDRVDQRDGRIYIVDYKTGEIKKPNKKIKQALYDRKEIKAKIKSFQLPVYLYIYSRQNSISSWEDLNAEFYSLKDNKEDFLFSDEEDREKMEEVFLPSLASLLAEIFNPDIDFERDNEDEHYCEYCPYSGLCR